MKNAQERVNIEKTLGKGARNKIFKNAASVFTIWLIAGQGKPTTETESPFQPAESRRTNRKCEILKKTISIPHDYKMKRKCKDRTIVFQLRNKYEKIF